MNVNIWFFHSERAFHQESSLLPSPSIIHFLQGCAGAQEEEERAEGAERKSREGRGVQGAGERKFGEKRAEG